jgi:hypothetical protein
MLDKPVQIHSYLLQDSMQRRVVKLFVLFGIWEDELCTLTNVVSIFPISASGGYHGQLTIILVSKAGHA